jgi:hypothetical protein
MDKWPDKWELQRKARAENKSFAEIVESMYLTGLSKSDEKAYSKDTLDAVTKLNERVASIENALGREHDSNKSVEEIKDSLKELFREVRSNNAAPGTPKIEEDEKDLTASATKLADNNVNLSEHQAETLTSSKDISKALAAQNTLLTKLVKNTTKSEFDFNELEERKDKDEKEDNKGFLSGLFQNLTGALDGITGFFKPGGGFGKILSAGMLGMAGVLAFKIADMLADGERKLKNADVLETAQKYGITGEVDISEDTVEKLKDTAGDKEDENKVLSVKEYGGKDKETKDWLKRMEGKTVSSVNDAVLPKSNKSKMVRSLNDNGVPILTFTEDQIERFDEEEDPKERQKLIITQLMMEGFIKDGNNEADVKAGLAAYTAQFSNDYTIGKLQETSAKRLANMGSKGQFQAYSGAVINVAGTGEGGKNEITSYMSIKFVDEISALSDADQDDLAAVLSALRSTAQTAGTVLISTALYKFATIFVPGKTIAKGAWKAVCAGGKGAKAVGLLISKKVLPRIFTAVGSIVSRLAVTSAGAALAGAGTTGTGVTLAAAGTAAGASAVSLPVIGIAIAGVIAIGAVLYITCVPAIQAYFAEISKFFQRETEDPYEREQITAARIINDLKGGHIPTGKVAIIEYVDGIYYSPVTDDMALMSSSDTVSADIMDSTMNFGVGGWETAQDVTGGGWKEFSGNYATSDRPITPYELREVGTGSSHAEYLAVGKRQYTDYYSDQQKRSWEALFGTTTGEGVDQITMKAGDLYSNLPDYIKNNDEYKGFVDAARIKGTGDGRNSSGLITNEGILKTIQLTEYLKMRKTHDLPTADIGEGARLFGLQNIGNTNLFSDQATLGRFDKTDTLMSKGIMRDMQSGKFYRLTRGKDGKDYWEEVTGQTGALDKEYNQIVDARKQLAISNANYSNEKAINNTSTVPGVQ